MPPADLSNSLLTEFQTRIGGDWQKFSVDQQVMIANCFTDAADQRVQAMAHASDAAMLAAIAKEKAQTEAQIANLSALGWVAAADAFWQTVDDAVAAAVKIGLKAL